MVLDSNYKKEGKECTGMENWKWTCSLVQYGPVTGDWAQHFYSEGEKLDSVLKRWQLHSVKHTDTPQNEMPFNMRCFSIGVVGWRRLSWLSWTERGQRRKSKSKSLFIILWKVQEFIKLLWKSSENWPSSKSFVLPLYYILFHFM